MRLIRNCRISICRKILPRSFVLQLVPQTDTYVQCFLTETDAAFPQLLRGFRKPCLILSRELSIPLNVLRAHQQSVVHFVYIALDSTVLVIVQIAVRGWLEVSNVVVKARYNVYKHFKNISLVPKS